MKLTKQTPRKLCAASIACGLLLTGTACYQQLPCDYDHYKTLAPQTENWDALEEKREQELGAD